MQERRPASVREVPPSASVVSVQVPVRLGQTLADVREGFFALCLDTGRQVLHALMAEERRLRARAMAGSELALPSFTWATGRDPLDRRTLEAIAVGVSTRNYHRRLDDLPAGEDECAGSRRARCRGASWRSR